MKFYKDTEITQINGLNVFTKFEGRVMNSFDLQLQKDIVATSIKQNNYVNELKEFKNDINKWVRTVAEMAASEVAALRSDIVDMYISNRGAYYVKGSGGVFNVFKVKLLTAPAKLNATAEALEYFKSSVNDSEGLSYKAIKAMYKDLALKFFHTAREAEAYASKLREID